MIGIGISIVNQQKIASGDSAPVNTVAPVITPNYFSVGVLLTCSTGTWTGSPTLTYAWYQDGITLIGTGNTYTPVIGDIGHNITCVVHAVNGFGSTNAGSSNIIWNWSSPTMWIWGDTNTWLFS